MPTEQLTELITDQNWMLIATIAAGIIAVAIGAFLVNFVKRRITKQRLLANDRIAVGIVIHRGHATGSEPGIIESIEPGRITVRLAGGRTWLTTPSALLDGAVIGGDTPDWAKRELDVIRPLPAQD